MRELSPEPGPVFDFVHAPTADISHRTDTGYNLLWVGRQLGLTVRLLPFGTESERQSLLTTVVPDGPPDPFCAPDHTVVVPCDLETMVPFEASGKTPQTRTFDGLAAALVR